MQRRNAVLVIGRRICRREVGIMKRERKGLLAGSSILQLREVILLVSAKLRAGTTRETAQERDLTSF